MRRLFLATLFIATTAHGQWDILPSHSTADFRGVDNVGHGIVWVSGTNGTILRSTDNGVTWQPCTTPPGADKLDFRGIQAFDANTAIAMSSGPGDASRLYKTTDGCQTWKLLAQNREKQGFWDAVQAHFATELVVLGDSVDGKQRILEWEDGDQPELIGYEGALASKPSESSFAASNSVLQIVQTPQEDKTWKYDRRWASSSPGHAYFHYMRHESTPTCEPCQANFAVIDFKLKTQSPSAGIFSFSFRTDLTGILVGGDYAKPNLTDDIAAFSTDGGQQWAAATTPPHGYRSAVAYDPTTKTWITVGPNGTDISTDDGHNWRALTPTSTEPADADKNWNALSLPFVVGPHGRIGTLRPSVLKAASLKPENPKSEAPQKN